MEWELGLFTSIILAHATALLTFKREQDRMRQDLKLEFSIEAVIVQLLDKQGWELPSFKTIKYHIRGFNDDVLRKYLVRAGAIAFEDKDRDDPKKRERWGLLKNNIDKLHVAQ